MAFAVVVDDSRHGQLLRDVRSGLRQKGSGGGKTMAEGSRAF
jgi:hypothetical protein